jgi:parallel beta-helix repeat protein
MTIILAVLLVQPFVVAMSAPATLLSGTPDSGSTFAIAQGTRLNSSELTDHVPFTIDGTADFGLQGWPGAGTPADPYVIAGLNITTDVGLIGIEVKNTNASFVIRDCFILQLAAVQAIIFNNTSAGTIEYTSVIADGNLPNTDFEAYILVENGNNTLVTHNDFYTDTGMCFFANNSYQTTFEWNRFESEGHRALRVDNAEYCDVMNNEFYNYDWYCTKFDRVNFTTISSNTMIADNSAAGIRLDDCYNSSISDCYIWGPNDEGIEVYDSPGLVVTRVTIENTDGQGVHFYNCSELVFTDSSISDTGEHGIELQFSPNSTISNINLSLCDYTGIYIGSSGNTSVTNIMIDDTGDEGVDCMSSDFMTFDDIIVNDVGGTGIYLESCTNGTLTNSVSRWTGSDGIYLWNCPNWTVTDNLVENTNGNGIQLNFGDNYLLTRNYVNVVSDTGINVDTSDNANVIDNHVTMADSEGYVVTTCENITFAGNTADECWDGGSFDTSDNAVIEGNIFTNLIGRGMYINDMVNIIVRNNVLSGAGDIGMDIDWIETSTFDGNDLTGFGFWFYPTRSYTYYNNTVVNNTVNGNDIYYSLDAVGLDLTASDYAQFIIINGSHVDIHDGSFDHVTNPIMFILSDNCSVWDVTATNNLYAIYYDRTDDCTVYNVNVNGGGNHYGLYSRLSDNFNLTASVFTGSKGNPFSGVHFVSSNVISVTDCDFSHN